MYRMEFSANRLLVQVVPRLQPARCGVSDQAILLAGELKAAFGVETAFIVLNSTEPCSVPFPVAHCAPSELLHACMLVNGDRPGSILVHLSGYGYSADGAPAHLASALDIVRTSGRFRVAVYFHELFASGMPWQSAFWYSRRQQRPVRRIAEGCDLQVTNTCHHAQWLERESFKHSDTPVLLLPVFSAAGETLKPVASTDRVPAIAVFGLAATRRRAYKAMAGSACMLRDLGIEEILDIGLEFDAPGELSGIPVKRVGALTTEALGNLLARTMFGFVQHPSTDLAKSSVFASYCAQGTIPVLASPFSDQVDGLKDGVHLVSPRTAAVVRSSGLERCSTEAWRWYSAHAIRVHAATYAKWLEQSHMGEDRSVLLPPKQEKDERGLRLVEEEGP
ncbi:MAG: hypothetical protein ACLGRW_19180 [Acidobacteriota bacterium]